MHSQVRFNDIGYFISASVALGQRFNAASEKSTLTEYTFICFT